MFPINYKVIIIPRDACRGDCRPVIRDDKTRKAVGYDFECKIETASKKFNIPILKLPKAHSIKGGLVKKVLETNLEH